MAGIMTPAMFEIALGRGQLLPIEAYQYADEVLLHNGTDPLLASVNAEIQRQRFVLARDFFVDGMNGTWPELPDSPVGIRLPSAVIKVEPVAVTREPEASHPDATAHADTGFDTPVPSREQYEPDKIMEGTE